VYSTLFYHVPPSIWAYTAKAAITKVETYYTALFIPLAQ